MIMLIFANNATKRWKPLVSRCSRNCRTTSYLCWKGLNLISKTSWR